MNEILLMGSVVLIYGMVLLAYRLFGKAGMYLMTVVATILANIEVLLLVDAFGMNQTLGNVLFASTYLVTDILSENEGKKAAARAVWMGVFTSALMLVFTQYWLLYTPSGSDWAMPAVKTIFQTTPRLMSASFLGYVVSQRLDVWLYHRLWDFTAAKTGDAGGLLWLRNNFATLLSQVINTVIFTSVAFGGWYPMEELVGMIIEFRRSLASAGLSVRTYFSFFLNHIDVTSCFFFHYTGDFSKRKMYKLSCVTIPIPGGDLHD